MADKSGLPLAPDLKWLVRVVVALTLAAMAVDVLLTYVPAKGNDPKALADTCSTVFKLGLGAVFGLIGGRTTA